MHELLFESAAALAKLMRSKQVSPVELLAAQISRIEARNPRLNAFVTTAFDRARKRAEAIERDLREGKPAGPLAGLPISIKDAIETAGLRTVGGTRLRESCIPAHDAPVVARLKKAGAIVMGKTNVPECSLDYRTENPVFGATHNPWALDRVPGGSSGGEAAAIAAGLSPAGVGSDLGGSIRVPAHFCGIVGLKPTPGRVPATGHFPPITGPFALGTSIGPMARRVEDLGLLLSVIAGPDDSDAASAPLEPDRPEAASLDGLGVMWHTDNGIAPVTRATREAVERAARALAGRGLLVAEQRPAGIEQSFDLWMALLSGPCVRGTLSLYEGKEELCGPLMNALRGLPAPPSLRPYFEAWFERDALRASVLRQMRDYPVILCPVSSIPAFSLNHRGAFDVDGREVDYLQAMSYVDTYNVLGFPAAVVPAGKSPEGLPIGVQVVGRPFEERTVLAVARVLEEALGGYQRPPD